MQDNSLPDLTSDAAVGFLLRKLISLMGKTDRFSNEVYVNKLDENTWEAGVFYLSGEETTYQERYLGIALGKLILFVKGASTWS